MPTERASDNAYQVIRSMILDLRLAPGAFLNEQALAKEIGFGRVPVREALARLSQDRFITVIPHRGNEVTRSRSRMCSTCSRPVRRSSAASPTSLRRRRRPTT
jgi:DNA-binding GntR family transcriptional regulator